MSKWKFTDIEELKTYGKELISHGPLTDERLEDALRQTEIFRKFSLVQIRTRIYYERLLKKQCAKKLKISWLCIHVLFRQQFFLIVNFIMVFSCSFSEVKTPLNRDSWRHSSRGYNTSTGETQRHSSWFIFWKIKIHFTTLELSIILWIFCINEFTSYSTFLLLS